MDIIHPCVIQSRSELGSKSYIFMENDKIISLTNLFQHLLSAVILSEFSLQNSGAKYVGN